MNTLTQNLLYLFMAIAALLFSCSIVKACIISIKGEGTLHKFFITAVALIGGVLATNLGAVIGYTIKTEADKSQQSVNAQPKKFLLLRSTVDNNTKFTEDATPTQKLQVIACWVYVFGLLAALISYVFAIYKGIPDEKMALVPGLAMTLLGVLVGALSVGLGIKP